MVVKNTRKVRTRPLKPILEEDGDFYLETPELPSHHTWRLFNQSGEILRGVFYADSKRNYTFLHRHESMEDIYKTTEHENIHAAIDLIREWEQDELMENKMSDKWETRMDDNEEHNMIRVAVMPEFYFGE